MLKGIPSVLSPELLKIMMEMGHGDEIVLADGNFPAASHARNLARLDAHPMPEVLEAILKFFPLDAYVKAPAAVMAITPGDPTIPVIWDTFQKLVGENVVIEQMERSAFYERAKKAYAIVSTGESALYANLILKKGVVTE